MERAALRGLARLTGIPNITAGDRHRVSRSKINAIGKIVKWDVNIIQVLHETYEDEDAWKTMLAGQMRYLMDVIPLDAELVKGSHGRPTDNERDGPVFITSENDVVEDARVKAVAVKELILRHIFN